MTFPPRALLLALPLIAAGCAAPATAAPKKAPPPAPITPEALRDQVLASSRAHEWVRELTDQVGPRLSGSAGDPKAVAWAVAKLKALGFVNVRAEKVMVPHWERGAESGSVVSPSEQRITLTALGGSVPTPPEGLEAEVVEADTLDALAALPDAAVKGKIVLFNKPMTRTRDGRGYGEAVPTRGAGASAAAKRGAIGALVRSVSTSDARTPHTGAMRYQDGVAKIPAAAVSTPDADLIHRLLVAGGPVKVRFTLGCRTLPDAESANVVGEIRGREKPDEIIVLGAHLDSWDLAQGAIDDGAGVGIVVEAARQLGALPRGPRRTVRVVLFANEENGLRGALGYAKAHEAELGKHVAAFEADSGTGKAFAGRIQGGPESGPLSARLLAPIAALGIDVSQPGRVHGVDISPLGAAGIPLFGLDQDASTYFDIHHSADDTFDKIDPAGLAQMAAGVATVVHGIANLPDTESLGRIPEKDRPTLH